MVWSGQKRSCVVQDAERKGATQERGVFLYRDFASFLKSQKEGRAAGSA